MLSYKSIYIKFEQFITNSSEMKEAVSSLIAVNKRRLDFLIITLREIKTISEDHRLRSHLLRSLRALQDTQTLNNPLVSI